MNISTFIILCVSINTFMFGNLSRSNNMVTDTKTKLMWQDNIDLKTHKIKWLDAEEYCKDLKLGGHMNWRLPNIVELLSIANKKTYSPAVYPAFKNIAPTYYWTSSTYIDTLNRMWLVNFNDGGDIPLVKYDPRYVMCVRPI